jgi:hypothetical protein
MNFFFFFFFGLLEKKKTCLLFYIMPNGLLFVSLLLGLLVQLTGIFLHVGVG